MARSKHGDEHGCGHPTKAACEKARKEALGRCVSMTADKKTPTNCRLWATSIVDDRALCTMHAGQVLTAQIEAERKARKTAELNARIDAYLAWRAEHPSVHDRMAA